jgi:hypothetical protein
MPQGLCAPAQNEEDLPGEVSTAEAARILDVSKDTVLRLKQDGLLEWRNCAPPSSIRPVYAFTRDSVMKLRTSYQVDQPAARTPPEPPRRTAKRQRQYKHLRLDDD